MILGTIFNGIMSRVQNRRAEEQQQLALGVLDKEEQELNNLFNANYHKDFMQRADVQGVINSARRFHKSNLNDLRNRSVIMGGTDEWLGANQKSAAENISSLYSNILSEGISWKDNVLNNYLNRKSAINDRRYSTLFNSANNYQRSGVNALAGVGDGFKFMDSALSNIAQRRISKNLGF